MNVLTQDLQVLVSVSLKYTFKSDQLTLVSARSHDCSNVCPLFSTFDLLYLNVYDMVQIQAEASGRPRHP
jgi:hypothetical protein